jgi:hypothetical protein
MTKSAPFQITVGTATAQGITSAQYAVDPSKDATAPWQFISLPETSVKVIQVDGATTDQGTGVFLLYDRGDGTGCTQTLTTPEGTSHLRILMNRIGRARAMSSNVNPELQVRPLSRYMQVETNKIYLAKPTFTLQVNPG